MLAEFPMVQSAVLEHGEVIPMPIVSDSDDVRHAFQCEVGRLFRSEVGRDSDLMSAPLSNVLKSRCCRSQKSWPQVPFRRADYRYFLIFTGRF
jgi:hypothetical protein